MKIEEISDYPPPGVEVRMIQRFTRLDGKRILEIGSGDGRLTLQLARVAASVLAVEPDGAQLGVARRAAVSAGINNIAFRVSSATTLRLPKTRFDAAVFSWSL